MTTVILGGNQFVDCKAILAVSGSPLLSVKADPLRVSLVMSSKRGSAIKVVDNKVLDKAKNEIEVSHHAHAVSVLFGGTPILMAHTESSSDKGTIILRLDLRPFGLNIFDDPTGLHVGGATITRNRVVNAAIGINLAGKG